MVVLVGAIEENEPVLVRVPQFNLIDNKHMVHMFFQTYVQQFNTGFLLGTWGLAFQKLCCF